MRKLYKYNLFISFIMNLQQFVQNENIEMLWDVISDEDIFKYLSQNIQYNIQQLFINNVYLLPHIFP